MISRGIRRRAVERFRLGYSGDTGEYATQHRLVIPYLSPAGPWQLKYRCLSDHDHKNPDVRCPKYTYDVGTQQLLYNAHTLLAADRVVVVEGELDAVSVEMAGVPAVAYPGAETWKKNRYWRWCFDSVAQIVVVGDGDQPAPGEDYGVGERAARAVGDILRAAYTFTDVSVVILPVGHDSNSFIRQHGDIEYLEKVGLL